MTVGGLGFRVPFKALLPKADLHVHLEGTITPRMVEKLAARNGVTVKPGLMTTDKTGYAWQGGHQTAKDRLVSFLNVYDDACGVIRTARDYADITFDYLTTAAAEGCIYAELTVSADHAAALEIGYTDMLDAIQDACEKAKARSGIEARAISTCVRHYGAASCLKVGKITAENPHPLVTGFGMAGDENAGKIVDFKPAFEASGLENRTAHAGEAAGPESVRAARDLLGVRRFGHMVRAIEDDALMQELVAIKAVPEVCVSSNLALKVFPSYDAHPLRKFFDMGLKVTLGSDDPSFFRTSIGHEYRIAQTHFSFTDAELLQLTRNAVEEAFVDDPTREKLLAKVQQVAKTIAA